VALARATAEFSLTYEGPALDDGRMDVGELAPALLALSEIFRAANRIARPTSPPVSLDIRAFEPGSFRVVLDLGQAQGIVEQLTTLLSSQVPTALANVVSIVVGANGLFSLIKKLRHRSVRREEQPRFNRTRLTLDDGTTIDTDSSVVVLYRDEAVRKAARQVVSPLSQDGVQRAIVKQPDSEAVVLDKDEIDAFEVPRLADTPLVHQDLTMALSITSLSFAEGNKWRFGDGDRAFFASIEDEAFLARVDRNEERFSKGDILICRVHVQQWQTETGLRTEYAVLEVQEHIPASRNLSLPFMVEDVSDSQSDGEPPNPMDSRREP